MVHAWLARYAAGGLAGLADRSSRPASCPHQMPAEVEARIAGLRREHPRWGPSRIRWELERAGTAPLPGRSTVYRALARHGMVDPKRKRRREDYRRGSSAAGPRGVSVGVSDPPLDGQLLEPGAVPSPPR